MTLKFSMTSRLPRSFYRITILSTVHYCQGSMPFSSNWVYLEIAMKCAGRNLFVWCTQIQRNMRRTRISYQHSWAGNCNWNISLQLATHLKMEISWKFAYRSTCESGALRKFRKLAPTTWLLTFCYCFLFPSSFQCEISFRSTFYRFVSLCVFHSANFSSSHFRELNELRKPTSDNPDILRFFKYMRAAKDGQDGIDCMSLCSDCRCCWPAYFFSTRTIFNYSKHWHVIIIDFRWNLLQGMLVIQRHERPGND